ncbi:MAG: HNH endonuclease [Proteobacteria bacterium]|nr:HNH endonuclease [Pseudomonadota bacterium]
MKEKFDKIRAALNDLEKELPSDESRRALREFSAFELPEIIKDIADFLTPLLTPYQAIFYWYLFRHSIIARGEQYTRVGSRTFLNGVVKPARAGFADNPTPKVSLDHVRGSLRVLEKIGAIRKEGEPNQEGTLYKVLIPEEIEACRKAMKARQTAEHKAVDIKVEVDYYNVRENRHKIFERDGYRCAYCSRQLTRFTATLDHIKPVSAGGGNSYDYVITA